MQTFEGNRDYEGSAYYTACVDSYQGFYLAVMSSRNERDTVPFVGTMGLFRRSALEGVGGWNEWCISEDTEASLRVLKAGWSGLYIPRCFGRGIVPPTFAGLNTQRHRWCFGAMQILRLHWRSLMPWDRSPDNHLTPAQRRDYLMASLGWFRDLLMLGFALLLLVVTGLLVSGSGFALMPLGGDRVAPADVAHHRRHDLHDVDAAPLDDHLVAPSGAGAGHQPVRHLGRRARLYRGHDPTGGRLPAGPLKATGRRSIPSAAPADAVGDAPSRRSATSSTGLLVGLRHKPWILIVIVFAAGPGVPVQPDRVCVEPMGPGRTGSIEFPTSTSRSDGCGAARPRRGIAPTAKARRRSHDRPYALAG